MVKYQIALALARAERFNTGTEPYQSAEALIALRNFLAHPKTVFGNDAKEAKLMAKLRGRFADRPIGINRAVFPDACITWECARWAVLAATKFVQEFEVRLPASLQSDTIDLTPYIKAANRIAVPSTKG